jgi:Domain of unknown function (DUF397)
MPKDPVVQGTTTWRKSGRSMNNGACVEATTASGAVMIRDSTDQAGAMLRYSPGTWRAFLAQAKMGKFDVKTELTGRAANSPLRESDFRAVKV